MHFSAHLVSLLLKKLHYYCFDVGLLFRKGTVEPDLVHIQIETL